MYENFQKPLFSQFSLSVATEKGPLLCAQKKDRAPVFFLILYDEKYE
jgi:hypothetical protein